MMRPPFAASAVLLLLPFVLLLFSSGSRCLAVPPDSSSSSPPCSSSYLSSLARTLRERAADLVVVDPTSLLPLLEKFGGLALSRETSADLALLRSVCSADEVRLDPVRRVLEVTNFTLRGDEDAAEGPALRVGRFYATWDSYSSPRLDVAVEDADVRAVFANLALTRSNFSPLRERGFPPALLVGGSGSAVRIGSLSFRGTVTLRLESAALPGREGRTTRTLVHEAADLAALEGLEAEIAAAGEGAGLTAEELGTLVARHFRKEASRLVAGTLVDLARGEEGPRGWREGLAAIRRAREAVIEYSREAAEIVKEREIEAPVTEALRKWGLTDVQAKWVKDVGVSTAAATATMAAHKFWSFMGKEQIALEVDEDGSPKAIEVDEDGSQIPLITEIINEEKKGPNQERIDNSDGVF